MKVDILIAGGGLAGLIAAKAFSRQHTVIVLDKATHPRADNRTTAFLRPSLEAMARWGIWDRQSGQPLETLRLVNAHTQDRQETITFKAPDGQPLGYNIANTLLKKALYADVNLLSGVRITQLFERTDAITALLDNGDMIQAKLLIVADGKRSQTRDLLGVSVHEIQTDQTALSFNVHHPQIAHKGVSTEIYHPQMSATLVPMEDAHTSAVVWMMPTCDVAQTLLQINTSITQATLSQLGSLTVLTQPAYWPIHSIIAKRLHAHRSVIIGEAAHGMPPIGAQGLNTSIRDIITLETLLTKEGALDSVKTLEAYARKRQLDMTGRVLATNAYNIATKTDKVPIVLRSKVFSTLGRYAFLQMPLIRLGMT